MATNLIWKLKRFGRFVPGSEETGGLRWKIFEATGKKPEIVLTFVDSGYLLVMQGQKSLVNIELYFPDPGSHCMLRSSLMAVLRDTISLLCGADALKVQQKSDNLMFRITLEGEGRIIRMQFDGSSRAEAIKECSSAVEKLMEYMPVTTQDDAPPPPNQSPAEVSAPVLQETGQENAAGVEPEVIQGSLSIKRLAQHFLGDTALALPQVYRHSCLAQSDLGPILRICLLDPSFPAFVEKVEGELRKLLEE